AAADRASIPPLWLAVALLAALVCWLFFRHAALFWLIAFGAIFLRHELARESDGAALAREFCAGSKTARGIGVVLDEPRPVESFRNVPRYRCTLHIESLALDTERSCAADAILTWTGSPPVYGDRVSFPGDMGNI